MSTSYRYANTSAMSSGRKGNRALPITLAGLVGVALWQNRDKIGPWVQSLRDKVGSMQGGDASSERSSSGGGTSGDDRDTDRPSVFNSTAMAGPREGAGATTGLAGGSMGTDLGTQGEGAL